MFAILTASLTIPSTPMQIVNTVQGTAKLLKFLTGVLPDQVPVDANATQFQTREELIQDVLDGVTTATMAIRMT